MNGIALPEELVYGMEAPNLYIGPTPRVASSRDGKP